MSRVSWKMRIICNLLILSIFSAFIPQSANANTIYIYKNVKYTRISVYTFIEVSYVFKLVRKLPPCTDWIPRRLYAEPGPVGSKSVLMKWEKPNCGAPAGGYEIKLIDWENRDVDADVTSSGKIKYLVVDKDKTALMIEGFDSSRSVELMISSVGVSGSRNSNKLVSFTAQEKTSAVSPALLDPKEFREVTKNHIEYSGTEGIKVVWGPSKGAVKYYVLQYQPTRDNHLAPNEIYLQSNQLSTLISSYEKYKYQFRVKTVGIDGDIAFSPFVYFDTQYGTESTNSRPAQNTVDTSGISDSIIKPGLVPSITQISSNFDEKTVKAKINNYDSTFTWKIINPGDLRYPPIVDSNGVITIPNVKDCGEGVIDMIISKTGHISTAHKFRFDMACVETPMPVFGKPTPGPSGFTVQIENYNASQIYLISTSSRCVCNMATLDANGLLTVTENDSGRPGVRVYVSTRKGGITSKSNSIFGEALPAPKNP